MPDVNGGSIVKREKGRFYETLKGYLQGYQNYFICKPCMIPEKKQRLLTVALIMGSNGKCLNYFCVNRKLR
jgi:hypothetical protein